jgi:serine/threonine protein kinase
MANAGQVESESPRVPVLRLNSLLQSHPVLNRFTAEKELGFGPYARTYLASEETVAGDKRRTVLKVVTRLSHHGPSQIDREWKTPRTFDSPYIVNLLAFEIHPDFQYPVLQLEYCNGGGLFDFIDISSDPAKRKRNAREKPPLTEARLARWFEQMLLSVKVLHDNGLIHRNIKPDNFLVSSTGRIHPDGIPEVTLKLADFGFAQFIEGYTTEWVGSLPYQAPELFGKGRPYDNKIDVWALGICLYNLIAGDPPTLPCNRSWNPHVGIEVPGDIWGNTSEEAQELVQSLLEVNPAERCTVDQALAHPWIRGKAPTKPRYDIHDNFRTWLSRRKSTGVNKAGSAFQQFIQSRQIRGMNDDES